MPMIQQIMAKITACTIVRGLAFETTQLDGHLKGSA